MRQWAQDNDFGHLDLERITEEFRDYWAAEAGQKAVKLDWVKTWRNRVRQVAERSPRANVRHLRGGQVGSRPLPGYNGPVKWDESRAPWNL